MSQQHFTVGLPEDGMSAGSRTTRIQPPGGTSHFDNQDMLPQSANIKQGNRILKPPGGMSSPIFSETDSTTSSNESRASSTSPKTPQKVYRMASNFELGDEQPENPTPRRKPFKPSVNPLTGELIGCPGVVFQLHRNKGLLPPNPELRPECPLAATLHLCGELQSMPISLTFPLLHNVDPPMYLQEDIFCFSKV